jgi:hypothetical protein
LKKLDGWSKRTEAKLFAPFVQNAERQNLNSPNLRPSEGDRDEQGFGILVDFPDLCDLWCISGLA